MKKQLLSGVASLTLLDLSAAMAADLRPAMPVKAPVVVVPSWTGFYVGAHGGYSWGSVYGDTVYDVLIPTGAGFFTAPNPVAFSALSRDVDPKGALGGIQIGYNFQSARVVYGVEADLSWTGQRDSFEFNGFVTNLNSEDYIYQETLRAKLQYLGTVRGRIGYAWDQVMPYVTGGFAWGRMKMDLNWTAIQLPSFCPACNPIATASFSGSQAQTLLGWTIGAGFEYAYGKQWTAKLEYLYVDLGKETYFAGVSGGGDFGLRDHIVRFGLNFRT